MHTWVLLWRFRHPLVKNLVTLNYLLSHHILAFGYYLSVLLLALILKVSWINLDNILHSNISKSEKDPSKISGTSLYTPTVHFPLSCLYKHIEHACENLLQEYRYSNVPAILIQSVSILHTCTWHIYVAAVNVTDLHKIRSKLKWEPQRDK